MGALLETDQASRVGSPLRLPPLALYIHIPWCVRKCPYCDFNSHALRGDLDEVAYVEALLRDLEQDLPLTAGRPLRSIFIGGGTPSLLSPAAVQRLLDGVKTRLERIEGIEGIEITLEANPGALEADNYAGYREAGVNRLSIGVQSFDADLLRALGRIHGPEQALQAVERARRAGFERLNLDLMFGLPGQTLYQAGQDLGTALQLAPGHLSYYQLTLEPNTAFHHAPPQLPTDERIWDIQQQGLGQLRKAGYRQYEVSAHARPGQVCRHNLNYWSFGDYLGIGAGAHAKLSDAQSGVRRLWKWRRPETYLARVAAGHNRQGARRVRGRELALEFMMNLLRLRQGFTLELFSHRTGLAPTSLEPGLTQALGLGLLRRNESRIEATENGRCFLNDLLQCFID